MDFSKINILSMLKTKMGYLSERQDVLSQNIANIDTPGYRPKDLKELDFDRMVQVESHRLHLRATNPSHQGLKEKPFEYRTEKQKKTYETSPTKNQVVVEEQMMKVAETKLEYDTATNLYKKMAAMFKTAIGNQ